MKIKTQHSTPIAEILVGGEKRKLYGKKKNKLYLNDGNEFQIRLENPNDVRIGVRLKINSEYDNDLLVLQPHEKYVLDRFLSTNKKFKFKTYSILGNTEDVKKAVKKNGTIEIEFWDEVVTNTNTYTTYPSWNNTTFSGGTNIPFQKYYWFPSTLDSTNINININSGCPGHDDTSFGPSTSGASGGGLGTSGSSGDGNKKLSKNLKHRSKPGKGGTSGANGEAGTPGKGLPHFGNYSTLSNTNGMGSVNTTTNDYIAEYRDIDIQYSNYLAENTMSIAETGKIEMGGKSDQKFVDTVFTQNKLICKVKYKLLPMSTKEEPQVKPIEFVGELKRDMEYNSYTTKSKQLRQYCNNCNYRIRNSSWKHCPVCGNKY